MYCHYDALFTVIRAFLTLCWPKDTLRYSSIPKEIIALRNTMVVDRCDGPYIQILQFMQEIYASPNKRRSLHSALTVYVHKL